MVDKPLKTPPPYAITSVDHALRTAIMLQLEGGLTVSQVAERLGVARSTAHRLLAMLAYRDFAVQDENRVYRAGPVLELAVGFHGPGRAVGPDRCEPHRALSAGRQRAKEFRVLRRHLGA
jgi:DNA-binding IclR family transcriptional regulator